MKSSVLKTCLIAALLSSAALTDAAEVYTWNKLENCKIAKINRQVAESARLANRDSLIKQYQNDVNKYCN